MSNRLKEAYGMYDEGVGYCFCCEGFSENLKAIEKGGKKEYCPDCLEDITDDSEVKS